MNAVKRQPRDDPRDHFLEAQPVQESLCGCIERSVQETVRGADKHVHQRLQLFELSRHVCGKEHDSAPQDCPQVQIGDPPCRKTVQYAGHQDIYIERVECLFPVYHCEGDREYADQVDVWCKLHDELGGVHDRAEHGKDDKLPGCRLHDYSALRA